MSIVGGFGIKSTRSASASLTRRPGSEAGWSIISGRLESSSEASAGACGETATNRACLVMLPLDKTGAGPRVLAAKRRSGGGGSLRFMSRNHTNLGRSRPNHRKDAKLHKGLVPRRNGPIRHNSG
jgi:hypothetical protein